MLNKQTNTKAQQHKQQNPICDSNQQTMGQETYKWSVVIYLPCSVVKSQQVLLSSHSHSYWKREAERCCLCTSQWTRFCNLLILKCQYTPVVYIDMCLTVCTLNQTYRFNPNQRAPKVTTKANASAKVFAAVSAATSWCPHGARTWKQRIHLTAVCVFSRFVMVCSKWFLFFYSLQAVTQWSIQKGVMLSWFWRCNACPVSCNHR